MTTIINATCACTTFTYQVSLPTTSLPIPRALCLCDSYRRISDSYDISYISASMDIEPSDYALKAYKVSPNFTAYFCSSCGAHVLGKGNGRESWYLATGIWDRTEGIIEWTGCMWVEDTLDGGISVWFRNIEESDGSKRALKRWVRQAGESELIPEGTLEVLPEKEKKKGTENLKAQCLCGGVKFYITRPNAASKAVRSPFPDLMKPYHSTSSANPENETWWLRDNESKYLAGTCACASCRLASGFEIQPWAFVPLCNIFHEDGTPLDFERGTLKRYESSKGVWREFCGTCGATVFWHCEERSGLIDVSVGLFDPSEGARAEGWLEWWTGRVSFAEMAVSKSLVASLEKGLKEWEQKR
ncbi:hypothetical protein LSUE1_G002979 [Lachnellula suecica]|uniref:CENP-V/GFA domain-containing protein n=1 Tax=Lachnellula suecica TaxID=602035 RepID=A0A8T9CM73_9HELO|nr:hypothetical protein LSUE1_G002979 [Lachnellula suecica]